MKYKPSFPPIAKLKFYLMFRGFNTPYKKWSYPFVACSPYDDFRSSPNLYAPPSSVNMTTMIRQHTKFTPNASSPRLTLDPYRGAASLTQS